MANPAVGIHVINTGAIAANTYTSAIGETSAATGSSFLVAVGTNAPSGVSVTDSFSNTYTVVTLGSGTNPIEDANDGSYLWLFLATNGVGGANHTATVTSADTIWTVDFLEIQNASTSAPVDASASAYSSTAPLNLPVTTTQANDLVLGIGYSAGGQTRAITPTGTGFTLLDNWADTISSLSTSYNSAATAGSYDPALTRTGGIIAGITIAFKPGSNPTPSKPSYYLGSQLWF